MDAEWTQAPTGATWIASVGHSDHTQASFIDLLRHASVVALVDVRHFPRSRVQHFDKVPLARLAAQHGIVYHHLQGLGGKRSASYVEHMATDEWRRAYDRLREIALAARHDGGIAAFMCVERDPGRCHRRSIAERLETDGWRVRHLLPDPAQTRLY